MVYIYREREARSRLMHFSTPASSYFPAINSASTKRSRKSVAFYGGIERRSAALDMQISPRAAGEFKNRGACQTTFYGSHAFRGLLRDERLLLLPFLFSLLFFSFRWNRAYLWQLAGSRESSCVLPLSDRTLSVAALRQNGLYIIRTTDLYRHSKIFGSFLSY